MSRTTLLRGWIAGSATLLLMALTLGDIGLTWDEPFYLPPKDAMNRWLGRLLGSPAERTWALSEQGRQESWLCCLPHPSPYLHPPVASVLSLLTWKATRGVWGDMRGYRLSSAILFSVVAGCLFAVAHERWGVLAASVAWGAWVLNPRVFAHGHLATTDMTMTAFWFLAAIGFLGSVERGGARWHFGVFLGLGFMSKGPCALAAVPQLLWSLIYRKRAAWPVLLWAALLTPLVVYAVNPAWWTTPLQKMLAYLWGNFGFVDVQRVPTQYLGVVYRGSLPWHNTLVLTAVCVPPAWVLLATLGLLAWPLVGRRDSFVTWIVLNWAMLMIIRATPWAPAHDGIRHFLGCFPFFALLAGYGAYFITAGLFSCRRRTAPVTCSATDKRNAREEATAAAGEKPQENAKQKDKRVPRGAARIAGAAVVVAALATAAQASWQVYPYGLTYYSEAIGGLSGAQRLGLETTYFWDVADDSLLDFMNHKLPRNARIAVPPHLEIFKVHQLWGRLRRDLVFSCPFQTGERYYDYYLFQAREGMLTPDARRALHGPAAFTIERHGVRLLALVAAKDLVSAAPRRGG